MGFAENYRQDRLDDAESAGRLYLKLLLVQILLACTIALSYFYFSDYLLLFAVIGVVVSLVQPAIFFYNVGLENKLNVDFELTDERHTKTVHEANEQFARIDIEIAELRTRLERLESENELDGKYHD